MWRDAERLRTCLPEIGIIVLVALGAVGLHFLFQRRTNVESLRKSNDVAGFLFSAMGYDPAGVRGLELVAFCSGSRTGRHRCAARRLGCVARPVGTDPLAGRGTRSRVPNLATMKNILCAGLVLALSLPATAALAASPAPAVSPATGVSVPAIARVWLHRLQTGAIDRTQLTDKMSAALNAAQVKSLSDQTGPLGDATDMKLVKTKPYAGGTVYIFVVTFPNDTTLTYVFALETASGKISGLSLSRAQ